LTRERWRNLKKKLPVWKFSHFFSFFETFRLQGKAEIHFRTNCLSRIVVCFRGNRFWECWSKKGIFFGWSFTGNCLQTNEQFLWFRRESFSAPPPFPSFWSFFRGSKMKQHMFCYFILFRAQESFLQICVRHGHSPGRNGSWHYHQCFSAGVCNCSTQIYHHRCSWAPKLYQKHDHWNFPGETESCFSALVVASAHFASFFFLENWILLNHNASKNASRPTPKVTKMKLYFRAQFSSLVKKKQQVVFSHNAKSRRSRETSSLLPSTRTFSSQKIKFSPPSSPTPPPRKSISTSKKHKADVRFWSKSKNSSPPIFWFEVSPPTPPQEKAQDFPPQPSFHPTHTPRGVRG